MRARQRSEHVDHGDDDERECQRDGGLADRAVRGGVHNHRTRPDEYEKKRAEGFSAPPPGMAHHEATDFVASAGGTAVPMAFRRCSAIGELNASGRIASMRSSRHLSIAAVSLKALARRSASPTA